ncbi:DUF7093 family protein [Natrialbaceae archaeon A-gly3]
MGLRCSLIGHDFGEPDVEREREERGSEVVVTVREYEECSRCGEKHVISETTEVTSLTAEASSDTGRPPEGSVEPAGADKTEEKPTEAEVLEDDTEILEDDVEVIEDDVAGVEDDTEVLEDDGFEDSTTPEPTEPADPAVPGDDTDEPVTDDAEILEEEATQRTDRQRGEWPDASDVGPPVGGDERSAVWPDSDGETTMAASESETGASSGVFVDAEAEDEGVEEPVPETEPDNPETGIASAQSVPAPGSGDRRDDAVMEFFCPRCEFVAPGDRGSLRAGDICPECRKGYLGERER